MPKMPKVPNPPKYTADKSAKINVFCHLRKILNFSILIKKKST